MSLAGRPLRLDVTNAAQIATAAATATDVDLLVINAGIVGFFGGEFTDPKWIEGESLRVLKPGGQLISISGPPDAAFARTIGASWVLRMVMGALSRGIRAQAKRRQVHYSFLFMRANGGQLAKITSLIDDGVIRPVVDRVFPFASTKEAMAYVEAGRARGKVIVSLKPLGVARDRVSNELVPARDRAPRPLDTKLHSHFAGVDSLLKRSPA